MSEAPVQDAQQVCIEFTEAEFKNAGSENQIVIFDPPAKTDLLAYQGMNAAPLLVDETLEAGEYQLHVRATSVAISSALTLKIAAKAAPTKVGAGDNLGRQRAGREVSPTAINPICET